MPCCARLMGSSTVVVDGATSWETRAVVSGITFIFLCIRITKEHVGQLVLSYHEGLGRQEYCECVVCLLGAFLLLRVQGIKEED